MMEMDICCNCERSFFFLTNWFLFLQGEVVERDQEDSPYKKCRRWVFECLEDHTMSIGKEEEEHRTLELFPLHPELGRWKRGYLRVWLSIILLCFCSELIPASWLKWMCALICFTFLLSFVLGKKKDKVVSDHLY